MFPVQDSSTISSATFLFENATKILSTFIPENHRRNILKSYEAINVKSFGTITFSDKKTNQAQFICIPPDASIKDVKELMFRRWCTEPPSLVISIAGGARDYHMKPALLRAFERGLLKVANTTGAWIITNGMNTGIVKLVGKIFQANPNCSRPIHLIGITDLGCVSDCHQLNVHGANVRYVESCSQETGQVAIEPNHTEFIFVDDESEQQNGGVIKFRYDLERAISGGLLAPRSTSNSDHSFQSLSDLVPGVLLVVEGDLNTVRTVYDAVVRNSIPVIFIDGSGLCCDLFAETLRLYEKYYARIQCTQSFLKSSPASVQRFDDELKDKIREALGATFFEISDIGNGEKIDENTATTDESTRHESDSNDYFELIYECIKTRRKLLNVIRLNARNLVEPDMDIAILRAVLNAISTSESRITDKQRKYEQFCLALEWNRIDIVKDHIMTREEDWENEELTSLFEIALNRNQGDFVKLFLDRYTPLTALFQNNNKLALLYANSMKHHDILVGDDDPLRTIYEEIIQPLIGDFFDIDVALRRRKDSSDTMLTIEHFVALACSPSPRRSREYQNSTSTGCAGDLLSEGHSNCPVDIDKELFLWSVITDQGDISLLFWARGKNKICTVLIAVIVYRHLARKTDDNRYYQLADQFENLAVEILDRFYQGNARACAKAIIRQIPVYGNVTWLKLAVKAEAIQFIAHRAVQDVLDDIWFGYIDQQESQTKVIFSTFMLWYSGFLRYHDEFVKTNEQTTYLDCSLGKSYLSKTKQWLERPKDDIQLRFMHDLENVNNVSVDFIDMGCFKKTKIRVSRYFGNILRFIRAPYVKYLYNLSDTDENVNVTQSIYDDENEINATVPYGLQKHDHLAFKEYILLLWNSTVLCEIFRQFCSAKTQSVHNKMIIYFDLFWNRLTILAVVLFYVGFTLRFIPSAGCFYAARIVFAVDLGLWFILTLNIVSVIKRIGPKLVMIGELVHDLQFFMVMLTVFILGFGVSSYSLIYGTKELTWNLPREIINLVYWQIFEELHALQTNENNYKANGYAVFILLAIFIVIVSIILVNLLIAMFSNTYNRVQEDTDRIWNFQRYQLICEYLYRPLLPAPFILLSYLWRFILYTLSRCIRSACLKAIYEQHIMRTKYEITVDEKFAANIETTEDALGDEVYHNFSKPDRQPRTKSAIGDKNSTSPQEIILQKIGTLENEVKASRGEQAQVLNYLDCLMDAINITNTDLIRMLERRCLHDRNEPVDGTAIQTNDSRRQVQQRSLIDELNHSDTAPLNVSISANSKLILSHNT
ncbi:unnamed protein product [Rotaria socialis]|uniref:TRPM SLOG domain-containing protein n=1 Tax=Rotaria socialis TaxID=392032 RepID=A0A818V899_9BILA|nr:unnamed protein product [Rotaria socialis]CAF4241048.1 unnamed protein product [Rotaria socialis]